ncbi:multiple sugar transport system ATP-binding protein [Palleronia aestuarii]|uniref:Multiple sugar transport system ATP-binding protein n=1 Tax=Palleronia aestuarii TaxID=568105 RepID=A0A2W7MTW1_9RHOB|nr:ABC transporter ATP-binding protein [Palleronia aestuarii]PZX11250.1 multiple sugar transport system ATP-binding protein [Palleronia aestuarii]
MATLELRGVSKRFGRDFGVQDVNLEVADREFVVLLGPSGCGKSTTLRMIAGLEEISEGEIRIGDRVVNRLEPKDRDIAMVFQSYGLYPNLTVYENIRFPLKVRRTAKADHDARVRRAAEQVDLTAYLNRRPAELSGGQRQRVALARAIVREPTIFLMDEPLSNLDAKLRVSTRTEIKALQRKLETTTIYVTHDQIEAMTLADRVVIMKDGVVQQIGSPIEIYDRPANLFVAGFIGSPPMNFLRGRIEEGRFEGSGIRIDGLPGTVRGDVVCGFRAEDVRLVGSTSNPQITAPITSVELLGDSTLVGLRCGGETVYIKAPKTFGAGVDERVNIDIPAPIVSLFDLDDGHRLDES